MRKVLVAEWGIQLGRLDVLHDKAKATDKIDDAGAYLTDLSARGFLDELQPWIAAGATAGDVLLGTKRIISCTSWTPDEDFGPLFWALTEISRKMDASQKLVVFITGKGELRKSFEQRYE